MANSKKNNTENEADGFLTKTEIEVNDLNNALIFKKMQGNILKGHGRDHATMIFLSFHQIKDKEPTRNALAKFAEEHVTSFYKQLWERERYKRNKVPGNTFGSLFITKKGYDYLQGKSELLDDDAFQKGMAQRAKQLKDDLKKIEKEYKKEIHAMLLLADDDKNRMDMAAGKIIEEIDKVATIEHVEYGDAIRNANKDGLEHNGYVDGISQPLFLKDEVDDYVKHHGIKRDKNQPNEGFIFNPIKNTGLVLLPDPYIKDEEDCYGSYFVFRKLEQDVKAFKHQEAKIGEDIYGKDNEDSERSGARIVGRFEDGTPIQIQGQDKLIGSGAFNNFNYTSPVPDPSGGKCPHFAHIRKTNPRDATKDINGNDVYTFDDHTMARRGIPYGHRNVDTEIENIKPDQFPKGGVGLLFMSYQKSIVNQFEEIQINRANTSNNQSGIIDDGGVDPVIGQTKDGLRDPYLFPDDRETKKPVPNLSYNFDQHIHFKGGEYFFAPSITYLESLKSSKPKSKAKVIVTKANKTPDFKK